MISDQFDNRVIRVDASGKIVASYGTINDPGFSPETALTTMNGPYSAYVIGDYTGITPPHHSERVPRTSAELFR